MTRPWHPLTCNQTKSVIFSHLIYLFSYLSFECLFDAQEIVQTRLRYRSVEQLDRIHTFPTTILAVKLLVQQMSRHGGHDHFGVLVIQDVMLEFVDFVELGQTFFL